MHDESATPGQPTDGRSEPAEERYDDVDPDDVVDDAIEFFETDDDEPAAVEHSTDGPPPPNA